MRDQFFVLFLFTLLVMGCQSKTPVAENDGDSSNNSEQVNEDSPTGTELTHLDSVRLDSNAEPNVVCEALLKLLQEDDLGNAQNLFTREATALILHFDLPLSFPGEEGATFKVQPAKYATNREDFCQVLYTVTEENDGGSVTAELGWVLKKAKSGWRVSGMLLPSEADKPMDFLNFESTIDVANLKVMLTDNSEKADLQTQSANAENSDTPKLR